MGDILVKGEISKQALMISEGSTAVTHKLMGDGELIAEVEFGNRNRIMKRKVQLSSAVSTKPPIFLQNTKFHTWQSDIPA